MAVVASFEADVTVGTIPFVVNFTDTSTGSPDSWWWDFGDGGVGSASQNPSHTYVCTGTYSPTLTAWVSGGSSVITATRTGSTIKASSDTNNRAGSELAAWLLFLNADEISGSDNGVTRFRYSHILLGGEAGHLYDMRDSINRLDLTAYAKGEKVIILQYRVKTFIGLLLCPLAIEFEYWFANDKLGDIPIFKNCCGGAIPVIHDVQMISSPSLSSEFDHAGELFDLQIKNGKREAISGLRHPQDSELTDDASNYRSLFQIPSFITGINCVRAEIDWQRVGFNCPPPPPPAESNLVSVEVDNVYAVVHSFSSLDSVTNLNYITVNDNIITRPPNFISGVREAYFKDGWENDKHFYLEQSNALPCTVQYFDLFINTTNE